MFLFLAIFLLIFLPGPWNLVLGVASLVLFGFEVGFWHRRVRRQRRATGIETLIGSTGEVTEPLAPLGQVKIDGEIWRARSATPADPGALVRVVAVHRLTLEVEPIEAAGQPMSPG